MHFTTETEKDQQISKIIVRQLRNKIETEDSEFILTYGIILEGREYSYQEVLEEKYLKNCMSASKPLSVIGKECILIM